jgi:excisionase family DNA binding protein
VARHLRVSRSKILGWIAAGELRAVNVARRRGGRPRWLVPADALLEFEQRRAAVPAAEPGPRRRRAAPAGVVEYF